MKKLKFKLYPTILALIMIFVVGLSVLNAEKEKRLKKAQALENYYSEIHSNWEEYQKSYEQQVQELIESNKKDMEMTKTNYETLLSQQPSLIASHTRLVEETTYEPQSASSSSSNSSSSSKSQVIKVQKPKSKPSTGAS